MTIVPIGNLSLQVPESGSDEAEARPLYTAFYQTWESQQPKAIRTLTRDFDDTLTFYSVLEQAAQRGE